MSRTSCPAIRARVEAYLRGHRTVHPTAVATALNITRDEAAIALNDLRRAGQARRFILFSHATARPEKVEDPGRTPSAIMQRLEYAQWDPDTFQANAAADIRALLIRCGFPPNDVLPERPEIHST